MLYERVWIGMIAMFLMTIFILPRRSSFLVTTGFCWTHCCNTLRLVRKHLIKCISAHTPLGCEYLSAFKEKRFLCKEFFHFFSSGSVNISEELISIYLESLGCSGKTGSCINIVLQVNAKKSVCYGLHYDPNGFSFHETRERLTCRVVNLVIPLSSSLRCIWLILRYCISWAFWGRLGWFGWCLGWQSYPWSNTSQILLPGNLDLHWGNCEVRHFFPAQLFSVSHLHA